MNETRWCIAHFSPTGTTAKVGGAIARGSGCPIREVDLSAPVRPETLRENEVLLVCVPVYGGRVPAVALERLTALKGESGIAVAVVVYGNRAYDNALLELKDTLETQGFHVIAAGAFVAEHSIVRTIAPGRPDHHDLALSVEFGASIMKKLAQGVPTSVQVPGEPSYREKKVGTMPGHPTAGSACSDCGICAEHCPVGAIDPKAPAGTDADRCINCMRCVTNCPQNARTLPQPMLQAVEGMLKSTAGTPKQPEVFL